METYLKLASVKKDKTCNCISPFYIHGITGINPNTGRDYSLEDLDIMKTALYRISNAKGCSIVSCCDPNDPTSMPDAEFTKKFIKKYPKIMPVYEGSQLISIKLSIIKDVNESGWQDPSSYFICKITKATIQPTSNPNIFLAVNLVNDCYNDSCSSAEAITFNNLLQNSKEDMKYTVIDDARVSQAILENNISYVKEYIKKFKQVDAPLTNNDYRNRMIHLASRTKYNEILKMLIALKANLNIKNKLGETPIHLAVQGRNLDNIETLLSQGVDLTIPTNKGETPMFYAMATGDKRIINMLYMNNSPILGVDAEGNNLIHYCILNCPTYKDKDNNSNNGNNGNNNSENIQNSKSDIIQWLIEHGISVEQKNNAGITPLELTSRQINREINKECAMSVKKDEDEVVEKFFGSSSGGGGAKSQDLSEYTAEHLSLLDIQTKLFNNIIRNNPNKYSGYINVSEIPKGAPIEILDTVCVGGSGITGNEDSEECVSKGGKITKVINKTTKIKLELIPEEESATDAISQNELYYNKDPKRIPKHTIPSLIQDYNSSILKAQVQTIPQTTVGMTYPIANSSNNLLQSTEPNNNSSTPSTSTTPMTTANLSSNVSASTPISTQSSNTPIPNGTKRPTEVDKHPSILDENNQIVEKCRHDAELNSEKFANTTSKTKEKFNAGIGLSMYWNDWKNLSYNQIFICILVIIGIALLINILL